MAGFETVLDVIENNSNHDNDSEWCSRRKMSSSTLHKYGSKFCKKIIMKKDQIVKGILKTKHKDRPKLNISFSDDTNDHVSKISNDSVHSDENQLELPCNSTIRKTSDNMEHCRPKRNASKQWGKRQIIPKKFLKKLRRHKNDLKAVSSSKQKQIERQHVDQCILEYESFDQPTISLRSVSPKFESLQTVKNIILLCSDASVTDCKGRKSDSISRINNEAIKSSSQFDDATLMSKSNKRKLIETSPTTPKILPKKRRKSVRVNSASHTMLAERNTTAPTESVAPSTEVSEAKINSKNNVARSEIAINQTETENRECFSPTNYVSADVPCSGTVETLEEFMDISFSNDGNVFHKVDCSGGFLCDLFEPL